jgi:cytochrome c553
VAGACRSAWGATNICHVRRLPWNARGGNPAGVPRLAGQNAGYLEHALAMFKTGSRSSPVMQPIAKGLGNADIHALASYLASLHGTASTEPPVRPPSDLLLAGERLARVGALTDSTPPCFSCHAVGGSDNPRFPSIAGQPAAYVVSRLHDFQARARDSPPAPATMTAVAARLDEAQVREVAAYLSTLPPP